MSDIQTNKIYLVQHRRKGMFFLFVTHVGDEWVTGRIVAGHANALLEENERGRGEEITVRRTLATFTEQLLPDNPPKSGLRENVEAEFTRLNTRITELVAEQGNYESTVQLWVDECDRLRDKLVLADTTIHQLRAEMAVMQSRMNEMVPRDGG